MLKSLIALRQPCTLMSSLVRMTRPCVPLVRMTVFRWMQGVSIPRTLVGVTQCSGIMCMLKLCRVSVGLSCGMRPLGTVRVDGRTAQ